MFGFTHSEVIGKKFHDLVVPTQAMEAAKAGLKKFAKTGRGPVMGIVMEMEALHKNGELFPVERAVASFRIAGQWYAVGSVRDISARKKSEKLLVELATTDALTGLANRRHFLEQAEAILHRAVRYKKPFSLLMFDLDHFKKINDTYGHDAGDEVLRATAATVLKVLRETDVIGRIGGEEFAAALPETDLDAACRAAERLRSGLATTKVETAAGVINFSASIGVTRLISPETPLAELLKQADNALYVAKGSGRNRVAVAS